jgi:1-acyl-sn-glycerol-3-phosphate acyltransferase
MAVVVRLPRMDQPVRQVAGALERRWHGTFDVDEWGFDREVYGLAATLAGYAWDVQVGGMEHLPNAGGALLVGNTRGWITPLVVAHAVHRATGRAVRFTGLPDVAPVGPALRKLGGVLARPDEVEGLLRAGHVVGVWCAGERQANRVGPAPVALIGSALVTGAPVVPVATLGGLLGRRWRVELGPLVRPPGIGGPLAEIDLAGDAREGVQRILDEATPPRWLLGG